MTTETGLRKAINDVTATADAMKQIREGGEEARVEVGGRQYQTLAGILSDLKGFTLRGDWAGGTAYTRKDLMVSGGVVYVAVENHTSTTLAADLDTGKIAVYQQGMVFASVKNTLAVMTEV
ncbi:MAG: hypothetical protein MI744_07860 [Pseudomonadales bacterium]|nr:hypothetical protein [Pseudomonadales bacterium]